MIEILLNQSDLVIAICVIGSLILVSLGVTWLVIRFSGEQLLRTYSGLVPNFGATLVAGFVLFVALVINGILHDRALAEQAVDQEAHALHEAQTLLDKKQHPGWHQAIAAYIGKVINDEWQDMSRRIRSHGAHDALQNLRSLALDGLPGISAETRRELIDTVREIDSARERRLFVAADQIPGEIWATLCLTALASMFFCAAIHARAPSSAYTMAALYGLVIGSMFFTIVAIDSPFLGPSAVSGHAIARLAAGS